MLYLLSRVGLSHPTLRDNFIMEDYKMPINYNGIIGTKQEKREFYQPYSLADIRDADEDSNEWALHWRPHGPGWRNPSVSNIKYLERAYGGSDMGTLMMKSHFKTRLELFHQKTGYKTAFSRNGNAQAKNRGHLYETPTALKYHDFRIGNKEKITLYIEGKVFDENGKMKKKPDGTPLDNPISMMIYRDGRLKTKKYTSNMDLKYPWALANCDGLIKENGETGLLEIKTTSPMNYDVIDNWKKGIVPESYYWQVVYYMAILNVMFCDIVCSWGQEMDTMAIVRIYRDYEKEEALFRQIEEFDDYVEQGVSPDVSGEDPFLLNNYYYEIFGPVDEKAPFVELPDNTKYRNLVNQAMELENEFSAKQKELDEILRKKEAIFSELYPVFKTSSYGQFRIDNDHVVGITLKTPMKRAKLDEERFKQDYPALYEECKVFSCTELGKYDKRLKAQYMLPAEPDLEDKTKTPTFKLKVINRPVKK